MSQKPFMWNNNNPVEWSDPSGYCLEDACAGEIALGILVGRAITIVAGLLIVDIGDIVAKPANEFRGQPIPLTGPPNSQTKRGNTVVVYGPSGEAVRRVDVGGRTHGGISPPQTQEYKTNKNPVTGQRYIQPNGKTRPSTPQEETEATNAPQGNSPLPGQKNQPQNSGQQPQSSPSKPQTP